MKKVLVVLVAGAAAALGWAVVVRQLRPGYLGTDDVELPDSQP